MQICAHRIHNTPLHGSIQNIKFEAFGSLQRGFYGIPYIGYFIAADVLHLGMSLVISYDGRHKLRMND